MRIFKIVLAVIVFFCTTATAQVFLSTAPNTQVMAMSPDGKSLYIGADGLLVAVNPQSQQVVSQTILPFGWNRPTCMAFHPSLGIVMQMTDPFSGPITEFDYLWVTVDPTTGVPKGNTLSDQQFGGGGCAVTQDGAIWLGSDSETVSATPKLARIDPNTFGVTYFYPTTDRIRFITQVTGTNKVLFVIGTSGVGVANSTGVIGLTNVAFGGYPFSPYTTSMAETAPDGRIVVVGALGTAFVDPTVTPPAVQMVSRPSPGFIADVGFSGSDTSFFYVVGGGIVFTVDATTGNLIKQLADTSWDQLSPFYQIKIIPGQFTDTLLILGTGGVSFFDVPRPDPVMYSLVNGASLQPGITPNSWDTIFGGRLGWQDGSQVLACAFPYPQVCNNARVRLDYAGKSVFAGLYFSSPNQINFYVPPEVPIGTANLTVTSQQLQSDGTWKDSNSLTTDVLSAAPAIFTDGYGNALIVHINGEVNTQGTAGESVSVYGNGLGPVAPGAFGLMWTTITPTVTVLNVPAQVTFAGLSPCCTGLYQVNFIIPSGMTGGAQPITISVGNTATTTNMNILSPAR